MAKNRALQKGDAVDPKLIEKEFELQFFQRQIERFSVEWDESKHPRDENGMFADKDKDSVPKLNEALRARLDGDPDPLIRHANSKINHKSKEVRKMARKLLALAEINTDASNGHMGKRTMENIKKMLLTEEEKKERRAKEVQREHESEKNINAGLDLAAELAPKLGWKETYRSKSGSVYYERNGESLRVSDHSVPQTGERLERQDQRGGVGSWDHEIVVKSEAQVQQFFEMLDT